MVSEKLDRGVVVQSPAVCGLGGRALCGAKGQSYKAGGGLVFRRLSSPSCLGLNMSWARGSLPADRVTGLIAERSQTQHDALDKGLGFTLTPNP